MRNRPRTGRRLTASGLPSCGEALARVIGGMTVSLAIAASLLSAPVQTGDQGITYPTDALAKEKSAAARIELLITPQGKIDSCRVLSVMGDDKFGRTFCQLTRSQRWQAAKDVQGLPIYGVVRSLIRMFVPSTLIGDQVRALSQVPDLDLTVIKLPSSSINYFDAKVSVLVDGTGAAQACQPSAAALTQPSFAKIACEQARTLHFATPIAKTVALKAFVIEQTVRFSLQGN